MLKLLTPFVIGYLMMGLVNIPSQNGYSTLSNLEMSSGLLMLAGHCNGDHGDDDHGDEEGAGEDGSSNAETSYIS